MMVLFTVAALAFFGWTVYGATRVAAAAHQETVSVTLRFDERELLDLVAEKRTALAAIKTSELDFETGKVGEDDFDEVMKATSGEAIDVMRRLDEVRASFRFQARIDQDLEQLDRDLSKLAESRSRRLADDGNLWLADDQAIATEEMSPAARARRQLHQDSASDDIARTCGSCGAALTNDDKLCAECGKSAEQTCAACSVVLHSGAKFCHECGERTAPSPEGV